MIDCHNKIGEERNTTRMSGGRCGCTIESMHEKCFRVANVLSQRFWMEGFLEYLFNYHATLN